MLMTMLDADRLWTSIATKRERETSGNASHVENDTGLMRSMSLSPGVYIAGIWINCAARVPKRGSLFRIGSWRKTESDSERLLTA